MVMFVFVVTAVFMSCGNSHGKGIITMTTEADKISFIMAGSGTVTIDWGDGSEITTHTLLEFYGTPFDEGFVPELFKGFYDALNKHTYSHSYSGTFSKNITITGENITLLSCQGKQLTSLDVSKNIALIWLNCIDNQLTSLDVSKNIALKILECGSNQLTSLDVSKNTALALFSFDENHLTSLDVSKNTALKHLYCRYNQLKGLDMSKNTSLFILDCHSNRITSLVVNSNTLIEVTLTHNQMNDIALNAFFNTLHSNPPEWPNNKEISINFNPGANTCNRSIATSKGWIFQ